jgi:hypothetical protein
MPLPRPRQIIEIAATPAQQPEVLGPLDRRPDISVATLRIAARGDRIVEGHLILVFAVLVRLLDSVRLESKSDANE